MIYFIEETDHTLELLLDLDDYTVFLNRDYWPYTYTSASKLLEDFWEEVKRFMKKEGVQL